jgi:hypothetical protein
MDALSKVVKGCKEPSNENSSSTSWAEMVGLSLFIVGWLAGLVLAKGFWSTLFALCSPWGLYLVVEKVLLMNGWL